MREKEREGYIFRKKITEDRLVIPSTLFVKKSMSGAT